MVPWRCLQIRSNIWENSGPDLNLAFRPIPDTTVFIYPGSWPVKCQLALTLLWWMEEVNTTGAALGERSKCASSAPAGSGNRGCSTLTSSSTEDNFSCCRNLCNQSVALDLCPTFTPKWLSNRQCVYTCSLHILQKSHTESMCVCLSHTYLVYVRSDMYILYNVTVYIWYTFDLHLVTI